MVGTTRLIQQYGVATMQDPLGAKQLQIGGVYLTFSGDEQEPYRFAKIIQIVEENLGLKLYHDKYANRPTQYEGDWSILAIPATMFFAWGPPVFPIFLHLESIEHDETVQSNFELNAS
jgi:hypothetical protein